MTVRDFENGYWYLDQLKNFAERIGIPAAKKLRKDELEKAIVAFLRTGKAALPTKRSLRKTGVKDVERGLNLKLRIENYTSNRETKDFIVEQARLMAPDVREKSGVWYRLNRWREEQITSGKHPTYGDLVRQYIALNKMQRFERIPHGRYINFVADFLEADKGATRAEAIAAWNELKELDVPKDYASWVKARANRKGPRAARTKSPRWHRSPASATASFRNEPYAGCHSRRTNEPKYCLRLECVVRAAAQLDVVNRRLSAVGERLDVVQLQESALGAPARASDERTPRSIALPHLAPHGRRNVPRHTSRRGLVPGAPRRGKLLTRFATRYNTCRRSGCPSATSG